jgi:ATP-dependent Clp protease adapter protein ClpS
MSMSGQHRQSHPIHERLPDEPQWIPEWFAENAPDDGRAFKPLANTSVYAVIVHDDDLHACRDFVELLEQVFGHSEPEVHALTQEITQQGRAAVWKGKRDEAEKMAHHGRSYQPQWRQSESVTAPHRFVEVVPPCTITVELDEQAGRLRA